ncbi:MAG: acyl-CoA thioesterase [Dichotomicrobium sp.]
MPETFRSTVHPWECDAVDHFTTGFYFAAYSAAQSHLFRLLGYNTDDVAALRPVACRTAFKQELAAGDAYHIESGVLSHDPAHLRIGHRLYNSETNDLAATHEVAFEGDVARPRPDAPIDWSGEEPGREVDFAALSGWSTTAQTLVRPDDLDATGRLDLSALILHTSDANVQFQNRVGMTSSYMRGEKIGYATFAYRITLHDLPREPGTVLKTESAVVQLGRSSLWFAHRVTDGMTGTAIADVAQFGVHFDRRARRSAPIPEAIRERAEALMSRQDIGPPE